MIWSRTQIERLWLGLLTHDGEEARREEESHGVVSVPPLDHRILHAGPDNVGL